MPRHSSLACGVTAVQAREPSIILGIGGTMSCEEYLGEMSSGGRRLGLGGHS